METLFSAILDLIPRSSTSSAAPHGQSLHSSALSVPGLASNHLSREDRLRIYWDVNIEITRDTKKVFFCLNCEHFVIGRSCFTHHTKLCLRGHQHSLDSHFHRAPRFWRWLNCGSCFSQEVLARRYDDIPYVSHVLHWSRLVLGLFQRAVSRAPWNCAARRPCQSVPLPDFILEYL